MNEHPMPMTLELLDEFPLEDLIDIVARNVSVDYMREFRKAGVSLGHA